MWTDSNSFGAVALGIHCVRLSTPLSMRIAVLDVDRRVYTV